MASWVLTSHQFWCGCLWNALLPGCSTQRFICASCWAALMCDRGCGFSCNAAKAANPPGPASTGPFLPHWLWPWGLLSQSSVFFNRFLNGAFPNRGSDDTEWERGTSRKGCTWSDLGKSYSEQCTLEKIKITAVLAPWSKFSRKRGSDFPLSLAALNSESLNFWSLHHDR